MIELLSFGPKGWGDELLRGAMMTLVVALLSFSLGILIGTIGAAAKLAGGRIIRGLAETYTTVTRGIPELLIIYLLFFGSSQLVTRIASIFGYTQYIEVNALTVGVLSVGLISGAYSTEVLRGAVAAVPKGQFEAAKALGMRSSTIFRHILVPQTLRLALPGLGNVWQLTLKDTALVSVTALVELMRAAQVAAGSERQPFIFYTTAAVLYLAMTTLSTVLFQRAERHYGRGFGRV